MLFVATSSICLDINLVSIFRPAIFQLLEEECFLYSLGQPSQGQLYSVCFLFPSFTNHIRGKEWENTVFLWITILPRAWLCMLSFGAHFLWLPRKVCSHGKRGTRDQRRLEAFWGSFWGSFSSSQKPVPDPEISMQGFDIRSDSREGE